MTEQTQNYINQRIKEKLKKMVFRDKNLKNAPLLIHSDKYSFHWKFAFGNTEEEQKSIDKDNPYHIASIGKTFTSLIIAKLYQRSKINYDDPISKYLSPEILENLFVYKGRDYSKDVLVKQLLNHTSGVADYYEDKSIKGKPIKELVIEEPDRFWRPEDTIDYTRDKLKTISVPGKKFHYSDTGYNLLGKIIEKITGKSFHENLHIEIFNPLGMSNSYFLYYSKPKEKNHYAIAPAYIGKHEVSTFKSLSADWAGGGIISTTEDLLLFHKALVNNALIKKETFELFKKDLGRFGLGMNYGYGVLFLDIKKMTFFLSKAYNMWGNFGSIASYMFYNPVYDIYIIGTFNHSNYIVKQVFFLIDVIRKVSRISDKLPMH
jgi:D-alanyl-D-alanine carboxypeptidase